MEGRLSNEIKRIQPWLFLAISGHHDNVNNLSPTLCPNNLYKVIFMYYHVSRCSEKVKFPCFNSRVFEIIFQDLPADEAGQLPAFSEVGPLHQGLRHS